MELLQTHTNTHWQSSPRAKRYKRLATITVTLWLYNICCCCCLLNPIHSFGICMMEDFSECSRCCWQTVIIEHGDSIATGGSGWGAQSWLLGIRGIKHSIELEHQHSELARIASWLMKRYTKRFKYRARREIEKDDRNSVIGKTKSKLCEFEREQEHSSRVQM